MTVGTPHGLRGRNLRGSPYTPLAAAWALGAACASAEPSPSSAADHPTPSPRASTATIAPFAPASSPPETPVHPTSTDAASRPPPLEALEAALGEPIRFRFNRARLTPKARGRLKEIATLLEALPETQLEVEGHCDSRGSTEYNLHLGEIRALTVVKYVASLGIEAGRLFPVSFGEERLAAFGGSADDHAQNRRVELRLRNP